MCLTLCWLLRSWFEKLGLEKVTNCSFFLTKVSKEFLAVAMQNCGDVRVD